MKVMIKSIDDKYLNTDSVEKDTYLNEIAYEDYNQLKREGKLDQLLEMNDEDFNTFKRACKEDDFDVTKHDFEVYLNYIESIKYDDERSAL